MLRVDRREVCVSVRVLCCMCKTLRVEVCFVHRIFVCVYVESDAKTANAMCVVCVCVCVHACSGVRTVCGWLTQAACMREPDCV